MISIEIIHTELLNANENEDISCVFFTSGFLLVFLKKVIVIHKNMYFFYKYGLVHNVSQLDLNSTKISNPLEIHLSMIKCTDLAVKTTEDLQSLSKYIVKNEVDIY
ncbi:hypothetical protein LY90DRAFT_519552 [Neocallimastix californiae]|uniref:Uncharacterized protein n=1 Tax=Neocallimastix californiae TaxID=1754190 RepID=A0A1Y1YZF9_9FUNG|nr:hypothetical protein LY90DRAFT_519552 [Neocallimastix californiae]|eukprot:ORY03339.1 hypothetical protein LY90DRAFT_519552 [Neocallimastix californiae]